MTDDAPKDSNRESKDEAGRDDDRGLLSIVQWWLGILTVAAALSKIVLGLGRWRLAIFFGLLFLGWTFVRRTLEGFARGLFSPGEKSDD